VQTFTGTSSGSLVAPDHEYPSHLELRLTATDAGGLSETVSTLLHPQTVELAFASQPIGLNLTVGSSSQATPFSRTVITGSTVSISANSPQPLGGESYEFVAWSDGGPRTHTVVANEPSTHTATFALDTTGPEDLVVLDQSSGDTRLTSLSSGGASRLGPATEWPLTGLRLLAGDVRGDGAGDVVLVRRLATGGLQLYTVPWHSGGFYDTSAGALWATVSGGGWSFDGSRQLIGDVDGDGRNDVVSVHRQSKGGLNVYVHRNTGTSFASPVLWQSLKTGGWSYDNSRQMLADVDGDGSADLVSSHRQSAGGLHLWAHRSTGSAFASPVVWADLRNGGWSYANSRQVAGDVNGDGRDDIVSSHEQSTGGLLIWAHRSTGGAFASPAVWSDLKTGGWSFDQSLQLAADIDADGDGDLYTAHRSSTGQYNIWTHTSTRTAFQAPSLYRDVLTGYKYDGAQFATSRH
jgi:hypothetical protein